MKGLREPVGRGFSHGQMDKTKSPPQDPNPPNKPGQDSETDDEQQDTGAA